jgi:hypothetical protein
MMCGPKNAARRALLSLIQLLACLVQVDVYYSFGSPGTGGAAQAHGSLSYTSDAQDVSMPVPVPMCAFPRCLAYHQYHALVPSPCLMIS